MWYHPSDLNREFVRLNRLANSMFSCQPYRAPDTTGTGTEKTDERSAQFPRVSASINEAGDGLDFQAEMPGVEKEGLEIEATSDHLTIKGQGAQHTYEANVPLRYKVRPDTAKASLQAGLLKLEVKLQTPLKEQATRIEVS